MDGIWMVFIANFISKIKSENSGVWPNWLPARTYRSVRAGGACFGSLQKYRGLAQLVRAPALGAGSRQFESGIPDREPRRVHGATPDAVQRIALQNNIMFYTYVLLSKKDSKFYIGFTSDLKKRFARHSNGECKSTKFRRPLELIYYEAHLSKRDALRREKYFKTDKGKSSLKQIIRHSLLEADKHNT